MRRILLVGDVGGDVYHVGDEASYNEIQRYIRREAPHLEIREQQLPLPALEQSRQRLVEAIQSGMPSAEAYGLLEAVMQCG